MDKLHTQIVDLLCKQLQGVIAIYAFGSWETAHQRPTSDIDLAVLLRRSMDSVQLWEVAQSIAKLSGKDVDLVDLLRASTIMRAQVISTGKRLYVSDRPSSEQFEDQVYSAYVRFNEERKCILEDIKQRGTVYG
jgi:uncharacterized protein